MPENEIGLILELEDKFAGCLVGGAIGDGLGTSTEWRTPAAIVERFGSRVEDFAPPFAPKPDGRHKGDGRVSDDTLMVLSLCRAYIAKDGHLDAHDMATYLVPEIVDKPMWVPEYQRQMPLIERLFYPEKYLLLRLRLANVNPREAGIGNMVNCGAAMYAAPVGLMNAGDPDRAYQQAVNIFSAHQYSYGLEAAAVMVACIAEAVRPNATVESIVNTALRLAKDGTHRALEAVIAVARGLDTTDDLSIQRQLRAAMEPFDTVKGDVDQIIREGGYPSQYHSIEEVPLALAFLVVSQGDFKTAVLRAANYGRDSDNIAGMVGALIGSLKGKRGLPERWVDEIGVRNRIDFDTAARNLYNLFEREYEAEYQRAQQRHGELMSQMKRVQHG